MDCGQMDGRLLTAHQHIIGYSVPDNGVEDMIRQ